MDGEGQVNLGGAGEEDEYNQYSLYKILKELTRIFAKQIQECYKKIIWQDQVAFILRMQEVGSA